VPLRRQTGVSRDGSAAAKPLVLADAGWARDVSAPHGQVLGSAVPLVHLPAGRAAVALQPHPCRAAVLDVPGQCVAVACRVPEMANSGVVCQGEIAGLPGPVFPPPCAGNRTFHSTDCPSTQLMDIYNRSLKRYGQSTLEAGKTFGFGFTLWPMCGSHTFHKRVPTCTLLTAIAGITPAKSA